MTALEPYRGGAALAQVATAGITADVRVAGRGRYALGLAGRDGEVKARLIATLKNGAPVELGCLEVGAGSSGAAHFPIVLPPRARLDVVYLEIVGTDVHLRIAAPPLPPTAGRRAIRTAAACLLAGLFLTAGGASALVATPPQLLGPAQGVAGTSAELSYASYVPGPARYRAYGDDGTVLAAGTLPPGRGAFAVALPSTLAGRRVTVELASARPFGDAVGRVSFAVVAAPAAAAVPSPRIGAFSARVERDAGGTSLVASYLASADAGEITVNGARGEVLGRAPFSHLGSLRLALPPAAAEHPLDVRLDVRRGERRVSTAIRIVPAAPAAIANAAPTAAPAPAPTAAPPPASRPVAETDGASDDPFAVVGRPIAGHRFAVAVTRAVKSMHLRLEDDAGNPVDELDVAVGSAQVLLHAPDAIAGHTYYLNCFYDAGAGQELIVRPVFIAPR